jgi:phage portal protein BeeE
MMEYQEIKLSPQDLEFIEFRRQTIEEICHAFPVRLRLEAQAKESLLALNLQLLGS